MRIVFANRYFHPDQSATSRMISSLAFALAAKGYDVAVIASRHHHDRNGTLLPKSETVHGVKVTRLSASDLGGHGILGRALDYAAFHLSAAWWWLRNARRGDLCVICTDPPMLTVTGALALALSPARKIDWIMDLFPETALELGLAGKRRLAAAPLLALRDWAHRRADLLICPIRGMAAHLANHAKGRQPAVAVVRHWSNGDEIRPVAPQDNALRREWGLAGQFVVGYSGNFGRAHDFSTLLDAAALLSGEDDIRFLMIGNGPRHAAVMDEVARRGLGNVIFRPFQPSERLSESLGAADLHLVSLLPCLEHCIVPSKFYGILAAGRPAILIGDPEGEIGSAMRMADCGETVRLGDAAALARHIRALRDDPERLAAMGDNARWLFEAEYTCDSGVERWLAAVSALSGKKPFRVSVPLPSGEALS